ncbi:hypothetical protein BV25DRAFT_1904237 [Artomyces pyxidatus]|uniref:Uncharacterized protein n=1 Tax=Artomyces pyxidatus TaxID=48021 RepID=A0ACB8TKI5_9AGAM|nr:hypothetical protein BV25DRAFT_1904237 [Artomyces pyxidatus]
METTTFPPSELVVTARHNAIQQHLHDLSFEVINLADRERDYIRTIEDLKRDLTVYKTTWDAFSRDRDLALRDRETAVREKETADIEKQMASQSFEEYKRRAESEKEQFIKEIQKLQGSEHRAICVIDGDGTIFAPELLAAGQEGGRSAARLLTEAVRGHLQPSGLERYQLLVYIFYNRRGLVDALGLGKLPDARGGFDEFVVGFNQAGGRFLMVDVGSGKDEADAKLRVYLEDNVRSPQTLKVFFGGCHDNGYLNSLRSAITDGFRDKLVLLPGYDEVASGIANLGLPSLLVPGLFMRQKIITVGRSPTMATQSAGEALSPRRQAKHTASASHDADVDSSSSSAASDVWPPLLTSPPTYKAALQHAPPKPRPAMPSFKSSSSVSEDDSPIEGHRILPRKTGTRRTIPTLPLSKHQPPPCTLFYLSECNRGAECKYSHDYILKPENYDELTRNAKRVPCVTTNKGDNCPWGDNCIYGHKCPDLTRCSFLRQGRCKFIAGESILFHR